METPLKLLGTIAFVCAICVHLAFGAEALVRYLGVGCVLAGGHAIITRKVPVGLDGQPPSGQLRGAFAVAYGLLIGGFGLFMLFNAQAASCVLGWSTHC